jgi:hypothetical protein
MMKKNVAALLISILFIGCKKDKSDALQVTMLNNPTDGEIVLSTYSSKLSSPANLMIIDKNGNVLTRNNTSTAAVNFKKWVVGNKVRYTYMEFDPKAYQISQGILPCTAVVLDQNLNEIKRVRLLPFSGRTASDADAVDAHEFIYLDDNHFITLSYFQKMVNNIPSSLNPVSNCMVVAPIIQEIQNDHVVWEWDGSNYSELYLQSIEGNAFSNANVVHDYVHMNSMIIDPSDGNLICSMRNLNQVIKINRTAGDIMWRLGGTNTDFPMTADMKFLRQHNVTLTDNNRTLLVFDNGEATERPYTRVDEFQLDMEGKTVTSFKAFKLPDGIFAQYMGSVQKRGDTYFIGCGSTPKILEVNYNTGVVSFMATLPDVCYRALKN